MLMILLGFMLTLAQAICCQHTLNCAFQVSRLRLMATMAQTYMKGPLAPSLSRGCPVINTVC